jgi:hypothetical protein
MNYSSSLARIKSAPSISLLRYHIRSQPKSERIFFIFPILFALSSQVLTDIVYVDVLLEVMVDFWEAFPFSSLDERLVAVGIVRTLVALKLD